MGDIAHPAPDPADPAQAVLPAKAGSRDVSDAVRGPRFRGEDRGEWKGGAREGTRQSRRAVTLGRLAPRHWRDGPASPPPGEAIGWGPRSAEGVRGGEMERAAKRAAGPPRVGGWMGGCEEKRP